MSQPEENNKMIEQVLEKMRKILNPGDYDLGSQPESFSDNDKQAWEELGKLVDEVSEITSTKNRPTGPTIKYKRKVITIDYDTNQDGAVTQLIDELESQYQYQLAEYSENMNFSHDTYIVVDKLDGTGEERLLVDHN